MSSSSSSPQPATVALQETSNAVDQTTTTTTTSSKPSKSFPPTSSIPRTPASRLADASPADIPSTFIRVPAFSLDTTHDAAASSTVLYLAYGSNLASSTFLGRRGIRPLSRVNVTAPSLRLTFDLPGLPYTEPCFANSAPRKLPDIPHTPPPGTTPLPLPPNIPPTFEKDSRGDPIWDKGLVGVVYEITREDYAQVVRTEGGGSGYQDILVPCFELPPALSVPEKPSPVPELPPRPFLAHTLFAPPPIPGDDATENEDGDGEPVKKPWWSCFPGNRRRPDPEHSQPSLRYLNLIRTGAAENDLPAEYQAWLAALHSYTITTVRQKIGRAVAMVIFFPVLMVVFGLGRLTSDKKGLQPGWMNVVTGMLFAYVWKVYDVALRPVFGDGERTESDDADEDETHKMAENDKRKRRFSFATEPAADEEKQGLLDDKE